MWGAGIISIVLALLYARRIAMPSIRLEGDFFHYLQVVTKDPVFSQSEVGQESWSHLALRMSSLSFGPFS